MTPSIVFPRHPELQKRVAFFWTLDSSLSCSGLCDMLPPEPMYDLVLSFQSRPDWHLDSKKMESPLAFIGGMRTRPVHLRGKGEVAYLAVRFRPGGLSDFLPMPLEQVTDQLLDITCLSGSPLRRAMEEVGNIRGMRDRLIALEALLLETLKRVKKRRPGPFLACLTDIHRFGGALSIQRLCRHYGIHPRTLEREFKERVGLSPKRYSRVVRFHQVREAIDAASGPVDWHDLVVRWRFHDQAHLIKTFRDHLDMTPRQYLQIRYPLAK